MVSFLVEHAGVKAITACSVWVVSDNPLVRVLSGDDVRDLVTFDDVMHSQREVFRAFHRGEAVLAQRALLAGADDSVAFAYLARASSTAPPVVKIGSVNPVNASRNLPGIHAKLLVMDAETGALCAIVDGEAVTLLRTAAATTVVVQTLAAPHPQRVSIFGSGPLALEHLRFLHHAFPLCAFIVQVRSESRGRQFSDLAARASVPVEVTTSVEEALVGADVVITATNAVEPVVYADLLADVSLLVSLGSFAPGRCEFGRDVVERASRIVVDDVATVAHQSGPIVDAIQCGHLDQRSLDSLGHILSELSPTQSVRGLTLYVSVGLGIQDAALADLVLTRAAVSDSGRRMTI